MDVLLPPPLEPGDIVRFVSPASTPERDNVMQRAEILESWGLKVEFGDHVFGSYGYMAGTDTERLADLNAAYHDPKVRAIVATRGGAGSYRIAENVDFDRVRADPKMLLGFSDITSLHCMLWRECKIVGVHGKLMGDFADRIDPVNAAAYQSAMMGGDDLVVPAEPSEITAELTTSGQAEGVLLGGHLKLLAAMAGWGLPSFKGAILMLEAVNMSVEDADRALLMLIKGGHFDGVAGIAVCQFTGFRSHGDITIMSLLHDYLAPLGVPILGGVPLGHGAVPRSVYLGTRATLDADQGVLISTREVSS